MKKISTQLVSPILKISANCWLQGDRVISYRTVVGTLVGGILYANGTYSRSTGRHLNKAALALGVTLVRTNIQSDFDRFELGVKLEFDLALSDKGSNLILGLVKEGHELTPACAIAWEKLGKRDQQKILDSCKKKKEFTKLVNSAQDSVDFIFTQMGW